MILRRFTKHITEQNWFAVGLDVLVVVVGIFLGLQVTEWNEDRKNQHLEQVYLLRLIEDLDTNIDSSKFIMEMHTQARDELKWLRDELLKEAPQENKPDPLFNKLIRHSFFVNPVMKLGTYEELLATGRLFLIQDVNLRKQLKDTIDLYQRNTMLTNNTVAWSIEIGMKLDRFESSKLEADGSLVLLDDFRSGRGDMKLIRVIAGRHDAQDGSRTMREDEMEQSIAVRNSIHCMLKMPECTSKTQSKLSAQGD